MEIMVGCPAYKRDWILPSWFEYVEKAFARVGVEPIYVFVADIADRDTVHVIRDQVLQYSRELMLTWANQEERDDVRHWTMPRYHAMVYFRNELLKTVRKWQPDYFFSLDSDILLNENALEGLLENTDRFDVVAPKVYMQPPGRTANVNTLPNYANNMFNGLERKDAEGVFPVEIVMAAKLMNDLAYQLDYKYHHHGEDLGICETWKENRIRVGWDGRFPSKHVMRPELLDQIDPRCGY